eukprot:TRINITY_DN41768_c0_g1_i1.p1 TRINITY_DN41768_c0_g1~~TRINITY_DN41768_c0_g1_i1.p1  ORF type:complete len:432 (+),score=53.33 TRINITY_DN41768_c0_g1_i1:56-1297(+)
MALPKGNKPSTGTLALLIVGMLLSGSLNTIMTKIQFTITSIGIDGKPAVFKKSWSGAFNMMTAMAMVLAVERCFFFCCARRQKLPQADLSAKLIGEKEDRAAYMRKVRLVGIPAAFDLLATALACIGMLYIPASVWQMLKGATLVFAAMFSVIFLKRKMLAYHWLGLTLCVVGICIVGLASILGESGDDSSDSGKSSSNALVGITFVLAGQVVQASQVIAEEYLMKSLDLPAMHVVGYEGIWGVIQMVFVVYPILYLLPGSDHGHQEDVFDTLAMISNNGTLALAILTYLFSCGTYNATGIAITGALSAVHRTMLDASRTMVIWAFDLLVHQLDPSSPFGETWTRYSYLQLFGFFVLVIGQGIYGEVIRLPCLRYPPPVVVDVTSWSSPGAVHMASPLPPTKERADSISIEQL